jgi:hypothetical protein
MSSDNTTNYYNTVCTFTTLLKTEDLIIKGGGTVGQVLTSSGADSPATWAAPGPNRYTIYNYSDTQTQTATLTDNQTGGLIVVPTATDYFDLNLPVSATVGTFFTILVKNNSTPSQLRILSGTDNTISITTSNGQTTDNFIVIGNHATKSQTFQLVCTQTNPNVWESMFASDVILNLSQ